ncbi:MAG: Rne/Rng family ribonuclease [Christensenellaceae bacterium]|jgi:ribonuclease G
MERIIVADVNMHEARVALLEDGDLVELQVELRGNERLVGNIYKGRVVNVLPGMQAAFIDVGLDRNAFLYAGDILADKADFEFPEKKEEEVAKDLKKTCISDMIEKGEEIIVQVLKQPGGSKGARVTTHITLPGRMMVLMPTVDHIGVSRKIEDEAERDRLKHVIGEIKPEGMGIIVRTAAVGCDEAELKEEVIFLARLWERVLKRASLVSAPRVIHAEETLLFRAVRDIFTADVNRFIINDKEYYEKVLTVTEITLPHIADRVELYPETGNIFDDFDIEHKIDKAFHRKVWIENGAYLVIDETEALTVIDVNTGKYIGDDSLQETILNTNVAAAKEVAKQLRLRDIGGIVVIDFIDMEEHANEDIVVATLEEALRKDRTKTNVLGFTGLGLVEMTRKKTRRKLSTLLQKDCPDCGGSGKVFTPQAMAMRVRREVNRFMRHTDAKKYVVEAAPEVVEYIEKCNDRKLSILDPQEEKKFYISANKKMGREGCKVAVFTEAVQKDSKQNAHVFF